MQPLSPNRRPGPSLWGYRLRRAWAKPWLRSFVRGYLPVILLALAGWGVISTDSLRLAVAERAGAVLEHLAARPEFAVKGVRIGGAPPALEREITALSDGLAGRSSLALDLAGLRARIEALPAVASARVVFDPDGTLRIGIDRRAPAALWRDGSGALRLIDAKGVAIREVASRFAWPEMALLIGPGAPRAVEEALALLEEAPELAPRLRGLARVGERRWDMVLDAGLVIMLPETRPRAALRGLMALEEAQGILERDLAAIDLRVQARPVLRLAPGAAEDMVLRRVVGLAEGEDT